MYFHLVTGMFFHIKVSVDTAWKKFVTKIFVQIAFTNWMVEPYCVFTGHLLDHITCCLQATCWAPAHHHMSSRGGAQVALTVAAPLPAPLLVGPHVPPSITGSLIWAGGHRNGSQDLALRQSDWPRGCCPHNSNNNSNLVVRRVWSLPGRHSRTLSSCCSKKQSWNSCGERTKNRWARIAGGFVLRQCERTTQQGAVCSVLLTKYHSSYQSKKTEMGRACSMYGAEERCIQGFSGETWRKETTCKSQA